jgi:hypothetical protein
VSGPEGRRAGLRLAVYIPFEDGSAVSYDGGGFSIHRQPVGIDTDLTAISEDTATRAWRERRGELVKALENAWWKQRERDLKTRAKKIYSKEEPPDLPG